MTATVTPRAAHAAADVAVSSGSAPADVAAVDGRHPAGLATVDAQDRGDARPVILAVDGNSLVHRSFHANAGAAHRLPRGPGGVPGWAVRGLLAQVAAAASRACADAIVVGFDDPEASERRARWPHYKAQRAPKPPGLVSQLELAVEVLRDLGVSVVVPAGLEADDVLASVCAHAPTLGARTVVMTSDRDAFALVDEHTRLLRVINGGVEASPMLDPDRAAMVTGVRPEHYRDLAALRGDPSDNLPGVRGVGPKRATLLLREFGSAAAAFAAARDEPERCGRLVGPAVAGALADPQAQERWRDNCEVMAMRTDVPLMLGLAVGGVGRLPLPVDVVEHVYRRWELPLAGALRALCGVEPREPQPDDVDPTWRPAPAYSRPRHPPLRRREVVASGVVQETLF